MKCSLCVVELVRKVWEWERDKAFLVILRINTLGMSARTRSRVELTGLELNALQCGHRQLQFGGKRLHLYSQAIHLFTHFLSSPTQQLRTFTQFINASIYIIYFIHTQNQSHLVSSFIL